MFSEAFSLRAGLGTAEGAGRDGSALRYGLARGAYANEAGYGTAAVVYGVAKSDRPDQQGLNAVMEVFIITFVTSTISALTILLTGAWKLDGVERRRRGGGGVQRVDPDGRRVDGRVLGVPVRLHDAHRAGRSTASSFWSTCSARGSSRRIAGSTAC